MKCTHIVFIFFSLVLSILVLSPAYGSCARLTYKESQDSAFLGFCRRGSVYEQDNNVWAVSEYARKRFALPKEWQDDGLRGAEMAAFRLEPTGRQRCRGTGEEKSCVWSFECVLELWIGSDIDIGITGTRRVDFKPWKSSLVKLGELNPELKAKWENSFGLQNTELLIAGDIKDGPSSINVIGYDLNRKKGLTMITILIDGKISKLSPEIPRAISFPISETTSHLVELPASLWRRAIDLHTSRPDISELNWSGGREEDTSIWVYSEEFARRYKMPASGISNQLVGAKAVAYHAVPEGTVSCGYFSDPGACTNQGLGRWWGVFDLYVPNSADLSFTNDEELRTRGGATSDYFLHEQFSENDFIPVRYRAYEKLFKEVYFQYRAKKDFWGNDNSKWFGGNNVYSRFLIRGRAWNTDFMVASASYRIGEKDIIDIWLSFINKDKSNNPAFGDFAAATHRVGLPTSYIELVLEYELLYGKEANSVVDLVEERYGL